MNFRKFIYPALAIICAFGFYYYENFFYTQGFSDEQSEKKSSNVTDYLPSSTTGMIVKHDFYTLSYSEKHEQAEWVFYKLDKSQLSKKNHKRPYFNEDPKVRTNSADWRNYKKSGYDRGHLCPAGDRKFSYDAFEETFLTSNISPQLPQFNQGIWNQLEQRVRYWTKMYDKLMVVTGGILNDDLTDIGYEAVSVPNYFYKIVFRQAGDTYHMIAFIIPNQAETKSLIHYQTSVDAVEKLTGIDFFEAMNDTIEGTLEISIDRKGWKL